MAAAGSRRGSGGCAVGGGMGRAVVAASSCKEASLGRETTETGAAASDPIWGGYEAGKDAIVAVAGPEYAVEDDKNLGCSLPGAKWFEAGGFFEAPVDRRPTPPVDHEWLKHKSALGRSLVEDPWNKFKIADSALPFATPTKLRAAGDVAAMTSPVSTLAWCWSPRAAAAPPMKARRASQILLVGSGEV